MAPRRLPRDSQRSRVYRAETPIGGRRLPTLPDCAAFMDHVVGSLWWADRFPLLDLAAVPRLRPGQGARQAFYREDPGHPTITLPRRYRTSCVVLHELAHWALADAHDLPTHGRTFARLLLDATAEFAGADRADRLAAGYAEHGVHIARPARRDADGRWCYPWEERLRLGRDHRITVTLADGTHRTGVLRSRAHHTLTLEVARTTIRVPEREVVAVAPLFTTPLVRQQTGSEAAC